jgi:ribosome assembly protein 1
VRAQRWRARVAAGADDAYSEQNRLSQVTGSLISAVRDACRNGLLDWSPRLKLAMYSCDIQASSACAVRSDAWGVLTRA